MQIGGKQCEQYIFATAPSSVVYDIPRGRSGFTAIGTSSQINAKPDERGKWRYFVYVDEAEAFVSAAVGRGK